MKKIKYLITAGLLVPMALYAQNKSIPAPKNASYIVEINLPYIFSQTSSEYLNNSESGRSLYEELLSLNRNYEQETDITKTGIDHNNKAYLHYVTTDSINYEVRLLPIQDVALFKDAMGVKKRAMPVKANNGNVYSLEDSRDKLYINEAGTYGILLATSDRYRAFNDSARAARYGITPVEYSDYYIEEAVAVDSAVAVPEPPAPPKKKKKGKSKKTTKVSKAKFEPPVIRDVEVVEAPPPPQYYNKQVSNRSLEADVKVAAEAAATRTIAEADARVAAAADDETTEPVAVAAAVDYAAPYETYATTEAVAAPVAVDYYSNASRTFDQERYSRDEAIFEQKRDSVMNLWQEQFLNDLLAENAHTYQRLAQLKDVEYPKNNSALTVYINSGVNSLATWAGYFYGFRSLSETAVEPTTVTDNWAMLQLNFEANAVRINSITHTDTKTGDRMKRVYKRKLNPKFAKYINSQSDIGVVSVALNTQNYLEEVPGVLKDVFRGMNNYYVSDEADILTDIFSLVVDEKAVGKAIWGDAAFVFTNIKEKEYQTIEYNWDEESYTSTEKEVTKTEKLPNFLLMYTTKDAHIFYKALEYGIRKGALLEENGIYSMAKKTKGSYDPFDYYCTIMDGIVFIGTDLLEIEAIRDGVYRGNLTKEDKKLLTKHNGAGWFYAGRMADKMFDEDMDAMRKLRINNLLRNVGQMQFYSEKIKNNRMEANYILNIPNRKTNSLEYLLYMFDDMRRAW